MTEFSLSTLLLSAFFHFCFLILSHPLYFSYFVFFFPYLLELLSFLSFLSPLFTTTCLLLLAFFAVPPGHGFHQDQDSSRPEFSESKLGFLATTYQVVSGRLSPRISHENEEFPHFEELELYRIVFETCRFETREIPAYVPEIEVEIDCSHAVEPVIGEKNSGDGEDINGIIVPMIQESQKADHQNREEKEERESKLNPKQEDETSQKLENSDGVDKEKQIEYSKDVEVITNKESGNHNPKVEENDSQALEMKFITSFGSTRKETTSWRKSLACKLFEERYNVAVGNEEMDLLWEKYETESMGKVESAERNSKKDLKTWVDQSEVEDEEEEDEGKICCLQALKFSTGKMRFGMGRTSSLVKISKAFKGFKLLQQVSKNGKKRHS